QNCNLQGANFSEAILLDIDFDNCDLENVIFEKTIISKSLGEKYYSSFRRNPYYKKIRFIDDDKVEKLLE
ncbi:TPA: pentapeptide repeat-containing protein, partial [Bacillus cereus]|nr:pentapeptide repeat-containing protein [Bacillus cereus]